MAPAMKTLPSRANRGPAAVAPGNRGEQPVSRGGRGGSRIHQHEAAGAIGILGHARGETRLAEGGCLLVAGDSGDGNFGAERFAVAGGDLSTAGNHLGQQRAGNVEQAEQFVVPGAATDVEEQRARCVRGIGDMPAPAGEPPHQPAIDRAERQLAALGALSRSGNRVEQPGQLGPREVGVEQQPGALPEQRLVAGGLQFRATPGGAPVLPDDGGRQRAAAGPVPQHGRLALVGDTDGHDVAARNPGPGQRRAPAGQLRPPDFVGIVLDPAGLREMLGQLALRRRHHPAPRIENDGARTGGALVEGKHVFHRHGFLPVRPGSLRWTHYSPERSRAVDRRRSPRSSRPPRKHETMHIVTFPPNSRGWRNARMRLVRPLTG
jgi:hypothetical protein